MQLGYRQSQLNQEISPPATPTVNTRGASDTMGSTEGSIWDGTAIFNSKGSVFSQPKDFPDEKSIKADPSLPSTSFHVCGRFSRYLPVPNMGSVCSSRAIQVDKTND
ncbi:hypothetical protein BLNAU_2331 [Blattamonas nauphoetae]|uniref:Uncharacterized protein n=1 Tax=Blattamonas nauphoetae TaxID=2049346 RepID=A0ABQ9YFJ4_9EUKA|nr:hypothetical protein BLNAU_2331 [Blattamonas nauphoetae]